VEVEWNYHGPRWRGRPEVAQIREEDTDWRKWLMTKPYRPFEPPAVLRVPPLPGVLERHSGPVDEPRHRPRALVPRGQLPRSVVAHGGVFAWPDGRENPDTFQALLEYPKGFLVSYSTSFGNDSPGFTRYMGKKATLVNIGGEGSPRYQLIERKGTTRTTPRSTADAPRSTSCCPGRPRPRHEHRRHEPGAHGRLARLHALPAADPLHGRRRLRALGGVHDGGGVLLDREKALLGCGPGRDRRSAASARGR